MDDLAHKSEDGRSQTVVEHLEGTAALAAHFAAAFGAQSLGQTAGLLHDIGKYTAGFQKRIRDPEHTARVDHSTAGAIEAQRLGLTPAAFAVAGHHTGLLDGGSRLDAAEAPTLFGRLQRSVGDYGRWRDEVRLPPAALPDFCGHDSRTDAFFTRMLYSCLVDADYLDTETFMCGVAQPRGSGEPLSALLAKVRAKAEHWLTAPSSNPLAEKRNQILRACIDSGRTAPRGLFTLTVPTGGGKTFSSLAFALEQAAAQGMSRVVYVIPYTSIIDQTAAVFGEILGPENVLAHYSGAEYQLLEKEAMSKADYRRALAAENWDAPIVVTTAVQLFDSLYAARSARCRKLHNLAGSVIVFDEAQTLPVPYLRPCVFAMAELVRHYGATAVLCTATQPALGPIFREFAPELSWREICPGGEDLYTLFRRVTLGDLGRLTKTELAARLCGHRQVLCVVNRRAQAQELFAALPEEGRYCLTTLLCAADRRKKLEEIRGRLRAGLPCRVVSTSLIEAGVDVSFPAAYREQTGLDSILQTAGRCNREGERTAQESPVWVFTLEGNAVPAALAQNVAALLAVQREFPSPDTPAAIERYFTLLRTLKGPQALDQKQILPAFERGRNGACFPFAAVGEIFSLIDTPVRTVYIPVGGGAELCRRLAAGERSRVLFRALGNYGVSVYPEHFDALYRAGALKVWDEEATVLADTEKYHPDTGLELDVPEGQAVFC